MLRCRREPSPACWLVCWLGTAGCQPSRQAWSRPGRGSSVLAQTQRALQGLSQTRPPVFVYCCAGHLLLACHPIVSTPCLCCTLASPRGLAAMSVAAAWLAPTPLPLGCTLVRASPILQSTASYGSAVCSFYAVINPVTETRPFLHWLLTESCQLDRQASLRCLQGCTAQGPYYKAALPNWFAYRPLLEGPVVISIERGPFQDDRPGERHMATQHELVIEAWN